MSTSYFLLGALTSKNYSFSFRAWEVIDFEFTNFLDYRGESSFLINRRGNSVLRILPKFIKNYVEFFLTDNVRRLIDILFPTNLFNSYNLKIFKDFIINDKLLLVQFNYFVNYFFFFCLKLKFIINNKNSFLFSVRSSFIVSVLRIFFQGILKFYCLANFYISLFEVSLNDVSLISSDFLFLFSNYISWIGCPINLGISSNISSLNTNFYDFSFNNFKKFCIIYLNVRLLYPSLFQFLREEIKKGKFIDYIGIYISSFFTNCNHLCINFNKVFKFLKFYLKSSDYFFFVNFKLDLLNFFSFNSFNKIFLGDDFNFYNFYLFYLKDIVILNKFYNEFYKYFFCVNDNSLKNYNLFNFSYNLVRNNRTRGREFGGLCVFNSFYLANFFLGSYYFWNLQGKLLFFSKNKPKHRRSFSDFSFLNFFDVFSDFYFFKFNLNLLIYINKNYIYDIFSYYFFISFFFFNKVFKNILFFTLPTNCFFIYYFFKYSRFCRILHFFLFNKKNSFYF